ncbi:MAG: thioredoxin [Oscillospiraceae bacterium]|nr:thioredoxin [Oscillospiraceae bacterium]
MAEFKVTTENFEKEVLQSDKPVLVDFWAEWCGPCRMVGPIIAELAQDYQDRLKVGKLNVDEQGELAAQFGIVSIPTMLLFKDGKAVSKTIGYQPKESLESFIQSVL